ncbi:orotidine-5'-phosphate decarboxylase [Bacillus sp. FSL K6-3431]|uniref:orotidine-5'-phosphate decarboxylase n=1 Tax=Bacillus sp. FSL K6-3431 TaxID=2921500 RepID=UPI0030FA0912
MVHKPIIALDFHDRATAEQFLKQFVDEKLFVKVGMELYYQEGPPLLKWLKEQGHDIFLDLKLHDIPNTVYRAMKVLAGFQVDIVNVHAAGGLAMMQAALKGLEEGTRSGYTRPKLIAVTQLTSTSESEMQKQQLITVPLKDSVIHYAQLANEAGLDGVVCSALEASAIAKATHPTFLRVTPGIRMLGDTADDQKRIVSPSQARTYAASMIVVGRSVTQAENPVSAYRKLLLEWSGNNE